MAVESGRHRAPRPPSRAERATVAIVAALLPGYLALEGGGYDLVVRQGLGIVVWWFLALAFAFGFLPRARPAAELRLAVLGLAGLVAWTAIGLLGTESEGRTVEELGRTLTYAGLFVLAWAAVGPGTWRAAGAGLTVAALVVPAIALASRLAPGAFEPIALAELLEGERLAYPLGYWNAVAAWSAMAFSLGLAWSAHSRHLTARSLALAALPASGVVLYLTYSRAGVAALLIGIATVVVASSNRLTATVHAIAALAATALVVLVVRGQPAIAEGTGSEGGWLVALFVLAAAGGCAQLARMTGRGRLEEWRIPGRWRIPARLRVPVSWRPVAVGAAVAVALAAAIAVGPGVAGRAGDEFVTGGQPELQDDPAARLVTLEGIRGETWASALRAFGSNPLTGIGAGSFQFWWERDVDETVSLRDAHSLYLETLAELGIPGLLAVLALLGAILAGALRSRRAVDEPSAVAAVSGLLAAYVVFLFHAGVDWLWEFPALIALGIGAGLVAGAARASRTSRRSRLDRPRMALVALAIVAGAAEIPALVSTNRARAAEAALALGLRERAAALADEAVRAQPWAADPYALRAVVALSSDDPAAARADVREAIEREPTNWRHRLLSVQIEVASGDRDAALDTLDEVVRLRPAAREEVDRIREQLDVPPGS
jgi:hypothetical protein